MWVSDAVYMPQAKWKAGERRAFATSEAARDGLIIPLFQIPPAGAFDADEQRVLSAPEYLKRFGHQLADCCGRRIAFVDADLIDDDKHKGIAANHPLTELLERARLAGATAAPVWRRSSSADYVAAVRRFTSRAPGLPVCFRLALHELEELGSAADLIGLVANGGASPENTVLLIDGGPLEVDDPEGLAHLLAGQIARLITKGVWLKVFWSATTFPEKPKLKPGAIGRFARKDWELYEQILNIKDEFSVFPMFSDYLLEFPGNYSPIRVAPTAHFRYSTQRDYLIFKGQSTRCELKYSAIFPVAKQLVSSDAFSGSEHSLGDKYIDRLASEGGKTGNASMWRWCSTDHHLAIVHDQMAAVLSLQRKSKVQPLPVEQFSLV